MALMKTRTIHDCRFDEIFYFAEKKYGIDWNTANDMFFRTGLIKFNEIYEVQPAEQPSYIEYMYENKLNKSSDVPREVFDTLEKIDKARVILLAFGEAHGVTHDLLVNSR